MDNVYLNLHVDTEVYELVERLYREWGYPNAQEMIQDLLNDVTRDLLCQYDDTDTITEMLEQDFGDLFDEEIPF